MSIRTYHVRLLTSLIVAGGFAVGLSSALRADQIVRPRPTTATAPASHDQAQARFMAERLYRAVLGREADPSGLAAATKLIQGGNLSRQVDAMVASPEFRDGTGRKAPADVLEQFYQGMHQRSPDPTGIALFIPRLERRAYSSVLMEILESPEFRGHLEREAPAAAATRPVSAEAAMACHARVLDAVTDAASGRVHLSFERAPEADASDRVIGEAVDRSETARTLSYQCEGDRASFTYADGRPARGADLRANVTAAAPRSCLTAAADSLRDARVVAVGQIGPENSPTNVFVTAFARSGAIFLNCTMNGQRVASVRGR